MLTQAFPGNYETVPSQGGGGVTGKQCSMPVSTPPPMVGTAPPPNHARYSTPHAATEQQHQPPHAGYQGQPSPSLPTAAGDGEEHTYINVTRTARTEVRFTSFNTINIHHTSNSMYIPNVHIHTV